MPTSTAPSDHADSPLPFRIDRRATFITIVIVTLLKVILAVALVPHPRTFEDHRLAVGVVEHGQLAFEHRGQLNHTVQFPVYPLSVAAIYSLTGVNPRAVLVFNVVMTSFSAWLLLALATRWLAALDPDRRLRREAPWVLWLTLVAYLAHPPLQQYVMGSVHPFAVDITVFYLALWSGHRYLERGERDGDLLWLGVVAGLVLLTRTVMLVALLPLAFTVWRHHGLRPTLNRMAAVLAVGALLGVPWLVRNYVTDGIVGYTSTTGEILWKGVRPGTDGSNYDDNGVFFRDNWSPERRASFEAMSVAEQNRYFTSEYLRVVRTEPARVATMYVRKLQGFFWFRSGVGREYGAGMRRLLPAYKAFLAVLLAGSVLAFVVFGGRAWVVWLPVAALGAAQAFFYVETRHRVVIEPLLLFLSCTTVASLLASWRERAAADGAVQSELP